jgi:hypothetical protein
MMQEAHAMYARVATYRGADAATLDRSLGGVLARVEADFDAPPEGTELVREVMVLVDRENGRALALALFDSEEDLRRGDAALSHVPMTQAGGVRTSVDRYEVALRRART